MFNIPNLRPVFYLAAFGAAVIGLSVVIGVPVGVLYLAHHLVWR